MASPKFQFSSLGCGLEEFSTPDSLWVIVTYIMSHNPVDYGMQVYIFK